MFIFSCSDEEGIRLIRSGGPVHKKGDDWKESSTGGMSVPLTLPLCSGHSITVAGTQVLTLESLASSNVDDSIDPFTNRLLEFEVLVTSNITVVCELLYLPMQEGGEFVPVKVDREILKSIPKNEVIIKNWGHRGGNQYYKVLLPEVPITICKQCQQVSNHWMPSL